MLERPNVVRNTNKFILNRNCWWILGWSSTYQKQISISRFDDDDGEYDYGVDDDDDSLAGDAIKQMRHRTRLVQFHIIYGLNDKIPTDLLRAHS